VANGDLDCAFIHYVITGLVPVISILGAEAIAKAERATQLR
jgi:hypothetical protein